MTDKITFEGRVVRISQPKIYKNSWGVNRRFYVEFEGGQKAMFAAGLENKFGHGDCLEIKGAKVDGEWMSVPESAVIIIKRTTAFDELIKISAEIGYITKSKEEQGRKFYLCYNFVLTNYGANGNIPPANYGAEGKIKVINFPYDVIWQENGHPSPPAYSTVNLSGTLVGDMFFVKEILGELPIQRFETIVIKVADLKYHRWGADFVFKFGNETFVGSVTTPFFSSPAYNVICAGWEGSVEVSGVWLKRGHVTKMDGQWKEEVFWQLLKGKDKWESFAVETIRDSVKLYQAVEGFGDLMESITQSIGLISYSEVAASFKKLGFDVTPNDVRGFLWHQDLDETYIDYLCILADEVYQTTSDEFFFYLKPNENRKCGVIVCEVPKERYSTIIIQEKANWREQISKLLEHTREAVIRTPALWAEIGIVKTLRHDADWETKILVALLEAGGAKA